MSLFPLADLKCSMQPQVKELWDKFDLESFQASSQPRTAEPCSEHLSWPDPMPEPRNSFYVRIETMEELHPCDPGQPDRNMHDQSVASLERFLLKVARRPADFAAEVKHRRNPRWFNWREWF